MAARAQGVGGTRDSLAEQRLAADPLLSCCPDLDQWPRSWAYEPRDVPPGVRLVEYLKPFLRDLLALSRTTLRRHRNNAWLLGGEIIRQLQMDSDLRKAPIEQVVLDLIDDDGGPLLSHRQSEAEQRSFDSTCRKLFRFLTKAESSDGHCSNRTQERTGYLIDGTNADSPATRVAVKPRSRGAGRRRRRA